MWINEANKSRKQDPFSFTCHLRSVTSQSELVRKVEENPAGCRAVAVVSFWGETQQCSPNWHFWNTTLQHHNMKLHGESHTPKMHSFKHLLTTLLPRLLQLILLREMFKFLSKNNYFSTRQTERNNFKEYMWNPNPLTSATKTTKAAARNWPAESLGLASSGTVKFHCVKHLERHIFAMTSAQDLSDKTVFSGF